MITAEEVKALIEGATQGPWKAFPKPKYGEWHVSVPIPGSLMRLGLFPEGLPSQYPEADAKLIAAVHEIAQAFIAQAAQLERVEALGSDWKLRASALKPVNPFSPAGYAEHAAYLAHTEQIERALRGER